MCQQNYFIPSNNQRPMHRIKMRKIIGYMIQRGQECILARAIFWSHQRHLLGQGESRCDGEHLAILYPNGHSGCQIVNAIYVFIFRIF